MKRLFYFIVAILLMCVALSACMNNSESEKQEPPKILVAYFSASGKTRRVSSDIAKVMNGTLHEIVPAKLYSEKDLDWTDSLSRSYIEMHDSSFRPEIIDSIQDMESYDIVFLGFPIWWGVAPRAVNSFIEKNDLKDKTIIVYATSGGSRVEPALDSLMKQYPDLRWNTYPRLLNVASEAGLNKWKAGLGIE